MDANTSTNDKITVEISSYASEGQGVGRYNGVAAFIKNTIVGEVVEAVVTKVAPRFIEARLTAVIEASDNRVQSACSAFTECGGCSLLHMSYSHQLEVKRMRVVDALKRIGGIDCEVRPCVGMYEPFRYRNKAVFGFGVKNGRIIAGCVAEKSHRIIEISDCLLQNEVSINCMKAVVDWANANSVSVYDRRTRKGILRHLVFRSTSSGDAMAVLVAAKKPAAIDRLIGLLKERVSGLKSIVLNINSDPTSVIMGKKSMTVYGSNTITESLMGLDFSVSDQSFLQVNHIQTEKLYSLAFDALDVCADDEVVDLYCGIGTISLMLAKHAKSVTGIEIVSSAINDANHNALKNGITNAEFICAPAEIALPKLVSNGKSISKLLLDPPRSGALRPALDALIESGVKRIVYVSCDPATLARDCKYLCANGYNVAYAQPVDMFPQTGHVECVTLMTRN